MLRFMLKHVGVTILWGGLLCITLLIALPFVVGPKQIKTVLEGVSAHSSYMLDVTGDASFTLVPNISLTVPTFTLTAPTGEIIQGSDAIVTVGSLDFLINHADVTFQITLNKQPISGSFYLQDFPAFFNQQQVALTLDITQPFALSLDGNGQITQALISLTDFSSTLGKSQLAGDIILRRDGDTNRSTLQSNLHISTLDTQELQHYLTLIETALLTPKNTTIADANATTPSAETSPPLTEASFTWSDETLLLAWLRQYDADITISADSIILPDITLEALHLNAMQKDGMLTVLIKDFPYFDGRADGSITAKNHIASESFTIQKSMQLTDVNLGALAQHYLDNDRFEAKGDLAVDIEGTGISMKEMISTLSGYTTLNVKEGVIKNIDIAALQTPSLTAIDQAFFHAKNDTPILGLTASTTIQNGMIRNDDLTLRIPFATLAGKGTLNLNDLAVDATLSSQNGILDSTLGKAPLRITGHLPEPKYSIDLSRLVSDEIANILEKNPEIQNKVNEVLGGELGNKLRGLF